MNVTIEFTPSSDLRTLLDRAAEFPDRVLAGLAAALKASGPMIVGNSLKHRFLATTGPYPFGERKLGRVSGRLRQSIGSGPPRIQEGSSTVTMAFGSNADNPGADPVKYFGIHEFGFSGSVPVRAHTRKNGVAVRSHTRFLQVAARAPMTAELQDPRSEEIITENARRQITKVLTDMQNGGPQ